MDPMSVDCFDEVATAPIAASEPCQAAPTGVLRTAREQGHRGGTGNTTWLGASVLASSLIAMEAGAAGQQWRLPPKQKRQVLELGAGTGQLAIDLARDGWRGITATDGEKAVVKNMRYNIQANRLGHAVRCLKWDWEEPSPKSVNLSDVDLCIGSDLVYYNRTHSHLAALLFKVLSAREATRERPAPRVLLVLTLRKSVEDGCGNVVHKACGKEEYTGSCVHRFLESELPVFGLAAVHLEVPLAALNGFDADAIRSGFHLYEVYVADTSRV